ncbi:MAG: sulfite exporter TauE/SafE family protein [Planctomycetota bacterium]|nr:MAG: sulfite exporter TauE/SafE family protein [Planctomycetota bacterium]
MQVLLLLIIGLSIGAISGALGIGGGVLLIPALIWLCRYDFPKAAGTTLAVLVPPIGLPAAWLYYKRDLIDVQAAVWIALAFALGAILGASIAHYLPLPHCVRFRGCPCRYRSHGGVCRLAVVSDPALARPPPSPQTGSRARDSHQPTRGTERHRLPHLRAYLDKGTGLLIL